MTINILVIPDSHAKPNQDLARYEWLGNYIVAKKPDIVVNLGDFADMPSLSSFDIGKKSFEGRRYRLDIEAVIEAQRRMFTPIWEYNERMKRNKQAQYKPKMYICYGNHEDRINRAVNSDAKLEGTLGLEDLKYADFGWEPIPYKDVLEIEGIHFSHFFTNQLDKAISSENLGRMLLMKKHVTCIQGHTHKLDIANATLPSGSRIWGIVAGCYFEHEEEYLSKTTQAAWWRGLLYLNDCKNGDFSPFFIPFKDIKERYSTEALKNKNKELLLI